MVDLDRVGIEIDALWSPIRSAAAFCLTRTSGSRSERIGHNDAASFEVGSCFKAFVVAECCRQVSIGIHAWDDVLRLDPERRVPASARAEDWPDGSSVTLAEAANAMIAVSDNTATDMVMDLVGYERIGTFITNCGLAETIIPRSVRSVYAQADTVRPIACVSTMRDLIRFYSTILSPDSPLAEDAQAEFRRLMRLEDVQQESSWPEGAVCYRKSGSLEPPPMFAQAIAGAIEVGSDRTEFAFAINLESVDETAIREAATVFIEGVGLGMRAIASASS